MPPLLPSEQGTDASGDVTMQDPQTGPFSPFTCELDWKVAEWVVKKSLGHASVDRLLTIPGVCLSVVVQHS